MEIKLNIDANQLNETVIDLFKVLTDEQKKDLVTQAIKGWLNGEYAGERLAHEEALISEFRSKNLPLSSWSQDKKGGDPSVTDDDIKNSRAFMSRMGSYKSVREVMVSEIVSTSVDTIKQKVKGFVDSDLKLKEAFERVRENVESNFPGMVRQAMTSWMVNSMRDVILNVPMQTMVLETEVLNLQKAVMEIQNPQ